MTEPRTIGPDLPAGWTADLPEIPDAEHHLLYHVGYYDGPLSGVLSWSGERLWFQLSDMPGDTPRGPWVYGVYRLTPESAAWEAERHAKFVELVGTHCEYTDGARSPNFSTVTHPHWQTYYDLYPPDEREPLTGELVGWFKW